MSIISFHQYTFLSFSFSIIVSHCRYLQRVVSSRWCHIFSSSWLFVSFGLSTYRVGLRVLQLHIYFSHHAWGMAWRSLSRYKYPWFWEGNSLRLLTWVLTVARSFSEEFLLVFSHGWFTLLRSRIAEFVSSFFVWDHWSVLGFGMWHVTICRMHFLLIKSQSITIVLT